MILTIILTVCFSVTLLFTIHFKASDGILNLPFQEFSYPHASKDVFGFTVFLGGGGFQFISYIVNGIFWN